MAKELNRKLSAHNIRLFGVGTDNAPGYIVGLSKENRRRTVAIVGDSFGVRETPLTGPNWYGFSLQTSVFQWCNAILGQRFKLIHASGVNGSAPWEWVTDGRVAAALATNPEFLWLTGALDGSIYTTQQYIDAYSTIFSMANTAGVVVICHIKPPNTVNSTSAHRRIIQEFNDWLINTAPLLYSVVPIDVSGATLAANSLTFQPEASILTDGTHYNCSGAFSAGSICARQLAALIPPVELPFTHSYGSLNGGLSQVLESPNMNGAAGGLSALTSSTGVPNGWTAAITAGESGTVNTSARTDLNQGQWLDFDVTFTAADKTASISCNRTSAGLGGLSVGDSIGLFVEVKVDPATISKLKIPRAYLEFNGAGTKYLSSFFAGSLPTNGIGVSRTGLVTSNNCTMVLHTGYLQIPENTTSFAFNIGFASQAAGNCKFSIGRVALVKE